MRVLPYGEFAVLIDCDALGDMLALYAELRRRPPAGLVDLVPGSRTVLVVLDHPGGAPSLLDRLAQFHPHTVGREAPADLVELNVTYDGEDLSIVAALTGVSPEEVVRRHTAAEYVVAFCGFAPGFGYLAGLDPLLYVPRRDTPRTRVPAGAVAIADEYTAVYPRESPGGWRLLGRTDARLWDIERERPALFTPGTRVRFHRARP